MSLTGARIFLVYALLFISSEVIMLEKIMLMKIITVDSRMGNASWMSLTSPTRALKLCVIGFAILPAKEGFISESPLIFDFASEDILSIFWTLLLIRMMYSAVMFIS